MEYDRIFYVVRLHESVTQEAANFIVKTLQDDGGLAVYRTKHNNGGLILHVTASNERVLNVAENELKLKKRDSDGIIREFKNKDNFSNEFNPGGIIGPLTMSDVHRCINYIMESIHFHESVTILPGHRRKLHIKKLPVLAAYRKEGLIESFPVHDDFLLDDIISRWKFRTPPLNQIRDYFGENVALYFSFTSFYIYFLIPTSFLGVLQYLLDKFLGVDYLHSNIIFAVINLIAVTCFLELWKRRSNDHSHDWGSGGKLRHKRPRPEYRGNYRISPISGELEVHYPISKTLRKVLLVSFPLTFFCLLLAFGLMLFSFYMDELFYQWFSDHWMGFIVTNVPSIVYSIFISYFNRAYLHMAHYLTEWENHRTQEQFEKWVVYKLVVFEFVNTFLALFYIAFVLGDMSMLKKQIFSMFLTSQIMNQIQETILPIFLKKPSSKKVLSRIRTTKVEKCLHEGEGLCEKLPEEMGFVDLEFFKYPYESTYDDLMELWLQFGHVFMFSSICPLAAFVALLSNLLELKVNRYRLCKLVRKPTPRDSRDLGAWYEAFNLIAFMSVITNLALLSADPDVRNFAPELAGSKEWILLFVIFEHLFLLIKLAVSEFIPDVSSRVKRSIDRNEYLLKHKNI